MAKTEKAEEFKEPEIAKQPAKARKAVAPWWKRAPVVVAGVLAGLTLVLSQIPAVSKASRDAQSSLCGNWSILCSSAADANSLKTLPGETGWIFAGYYNIDSGAFSEGPWVSVIDTNSRGLRQFIQRGDIIGLKVARKVIIPNFQNDDTANSLKSPIARGVISRQDETGLTLDKDTQLLVRDVSSGHFPGHSDAALWLRVVDVPR